MRKLILVPIVNKHYGHPNAQPKGKGNELRVDSLRLHNRLYMLCDANTGKPVTKIDWPPEYQMAAD